MVLIEETEIEIKIDDGERWTSLSGPSVPIFRNSKSEITPTTKNILPTHDPALKTHYSEPTGTEKRKMNIYSLLSSSSTWRSMSMGFPIQIETIHCTICYENVGVQDSYTLTGEPCSHKFCKECLSTHLVLKISEGQVKNPCPLVGEDDCGNFATEKDISYLCGAEILEKFQRFERMQADGNHRECPSCGHLQLGSRKKPAMTCEKCTAAFCFFHSNAHPEESCKAYAKRLRIITRETKKEVKRTSKKCPGCKAPTQKSGGCNHMTCATCQTNWCWLCGRNMGRNFSRHYQWWNICGCAGAQFQSNQITSCLLGYRLFTVLVLLIGLPFYILTFILLLLMSILCCPCFAVCMIFSSHGCSCRSLRVFFKGLCKVSIYPAGLCTFLILLLFAHIFSLLLGIMVLVVSPILCALGYTREKMVKFVLLPISIVVNFFLRGGG